MSKLAYIALGILAGCVCTLIILAIDVATLFTSGGGLLCFHSRYCGITLISLDPVKSV